MSNIKISVYGAGSWGCALACQVAKIQQVVRLYTRSNSTKQEILTQRTNQKYLHNIILPKNIEPSTEIQNFLEQDVLIIAVPSTVIIDTLNKLKDSNISTDTILVIATKGLVDNPIRFISQAIEEILPNDYAFLSGPNFAHEIASNKIAHTTIACKDINIAQRLASYIASDNFIITTTNDVATIQIAGVVKNLVAIQAGMYDAVSQGENAKAALISQVLKEINIIAQKFDGKIETLLEPGVIGDVVLSAYSNQSRNNKFGYEFVQARDKKQFISEYPYLVEGVKSAKLLSRLLKQHNIKVPVIEHIVNTIILFC